MDFELATSLWGAASTSAKLPAEVKTSLPADGLIPHSNQPLEMVVVLPTSTDEETEAGESWALGLVIGKPVLESVSVGAGWCNLEILEALWHAPALPDVCSERQMCTSTLWPSVI